MNLRGRVVGVGAVALTVSLSVALAEGTFPGRNGQIVFEQLTDTGDQIAVMGPTGSNLHQLTTDGGRSPAISPDGSHVVYTADQSCGPRCGMSYLVIMRSDGSDAGPLTRPVAGREDDNASFSADGRSVVFHRSYAPRPGIWTIDIDGGDERRLLRERSGEILDSPEYSPNGRKIAFDRFTFGPSRSRIFTMNRKGKHLAELTDNRSGLDSEPSWSPDGKRIAFRGICKKKCRDSEVYVMKADGSRVKRITHDRGFQEEPHWSPDGRRVAYVTFVRNRGQIAAKRPVPSARESLLSPTTPPSDVVVFDWGPRASE
jgi:Tol biopolymer transport system component